MSIYNALYGRDGHGVGPNEPEKKGFARFCQMVGRDLGQLLGTNLMVCVLCLPAALGVSLGVTLLSLPLTVVCSAVTGLLTPTARRCPHLGCALKWNPAEHTWDCPCHGSRFTREGRLIDNPATGDLKPH